MTKIDSTDICRRNRDALRIPQGGTEIDMTILEIMKSVKPDADFENCDDFIAASLLDSYEIVELVEALEDEFGVFIDGMEILPENFVSVDTIQALVDRSEKQ